MIRMLWEFIVLYFKFGFKKKVITVFGSARTKKSSKIYKDITKICKILAKKGYAIATGSGPGIMEAANKGARMGKGRSYGIGIDLFMEQVHNKYVDKFFLCRYFQPRKWIYINIPIAYIVGPGGVGTMDELFEVLTLIQTGKIPKRPIFLVGRYFWEPVMDLMVNVLAKHKMIHVEDVSLMQIIDSADEILEVLNGEV